VTSAPIDSLRNLPLKRLKEYLAAYNIPNIGPKEKEDFVQAVIKARNARTGSLSPEAEVCSSPLLPLIPELTVQAYYRRNSVPKKSQARPPPPSQPQSQARPTAPRPPPMSHTQARPPAQAARQPQPQARPPPTTSYRPPPSYARPQAAPSPARPRPAPAPAVAKAPPPPVPTIMGLVSLPNSYLSSLSIGTLKAILYENHVKVDFKQVLEK